MLSDKQMLVPPGGVDQWVCLAGSGHATVPLIALHGGPGGNHWVFERTAGKRLERSRTVVYHEQRGCGRSVPLEHPSAYSVQVLVDDVRALIDWLDVPVVDLLGYSFGGGLALEVARVDPGRVRRVVAQAPAFRLADPEVTGHQIAGLTLAARGEIKTQIQQLDLQDPVARLEAIWSLVDTETVDRFLFQNLEHAQFNRKGWEESGLVNTGDLARALSSQPGPEVADLLLKLQVPVLVVSGRHDRNVPLSAPAQVAKLLPRAELAIFEHSAHFPDIEETDLFVETVLDFLESPSR